MTKSSFKMALLGSLTAVMAISGATAAELGAKDDPIKLAINEWTGQHVTTHIAGSILESMGYKVEYITAGYAPMVPSIAQGDLHGALEMWNNLGDDSLKKEMDAGNIVSLGSLGLETKEGWMYPKYMEATCPGLPDYKALITCVGKMATADTFPKGRILAYPADWGVRTESKIKGLNLPYQSVPAGGEGALVTELKAAVAAKRPLVMEFWAPHWVLSEVDEAWITGMPAWSAECENDASWGANADAVHDCGYDDPKVTKSVWSGFGEKWPAAGEFLTAFQMDAGQQELMMKAIDQEDQKLDAVVAKWVAENEATWKPWVDGAMN